MDRPDTWRIPQIFDQLKDFLSLKLNSHPSIKGSSDQAWCAADRLLVEYVAVHAESSPRTPLPSVLAVNDEHGAIALSLLGADVWTDSAMGMLSIQQNASANGVSCPRLLPITEKPNAQYDLVLLRIPKDLDYFAWQLEQLSQILPEGAAVVCGGMDKHLSRNTAQLIESVLGETERLPGARKARLFVSRIKGARQSKRDYQTTIEVPLLPLPLVSQPGLFGWRKLDAGTELLLEHLAELPPAVRVMDLACGNGVLGIAASLALGCTETIFCDESHLAISIAKRNSDSMLQIQSCRFICADGLKTYQGPDPDLILCNPPFHNQHRVSEAYGRRLLRQAVQHLQPSGHLWVVGNRHLNYAAMLRDLVSEVRQIAGDNKFTLWEASK